jgi:hypothetical protein
MPAGIGELFLQCWRMRSPFSLAASGGSDEPTERRSITNPLVARNQKRQFVLVVCKGCLFHFTGHQVTESTKSAS